MNYIMYSGGGFGGGSDSNNSNNARNLFPNYYDPDFNVGQRSLK